MKQNSTRIPELFLLRQDSVVVPHVLRTEPFVEYCFQGPVSRKSRKLFGPEKPFVKLRPAYSVKLVFSYVVKGIKIKITAKFRASRRLRFEDTKRIMAPEIRPKSFGTFEKQAQYLEHVPLIRGSSRARRWPILSLQ